MKMTHVEAIATDAIARRCITEKQLSDLQDLKESGRLDLHDLRRYEIIMNAIEDGSLPLVV